MPNDMSLRQRTPCDRTKQRENRSEPTICSNKSARCSRYVDVFRRHAEKHAQQATSSCQPRLTQTVSPWLILALLRQHSVGGDAAGGHEQLRVRVTVVGAVRNSRGGTKTAIAAAVHVGACVEMVLINPEECIKEQIVDAPVLQFQEGGAEQIVDFTVPSIKEGLVEVSASGADPRAHRGAKGRISRARSDHLARCFRLCFRSASTGTSWSRTWPSVASAVFQLFLDERISERIEPEHP